MAAQRFALLGLALLCLANSCIAEDMLCVLPAKILSGPSGGTVGGRIRSPVSADVVSNMRSSVSGVVNIVFPQGSCPTPSNVASALSKAYLATPYGWQGINVGPTTAAVMMPNTGTKVADLSVSGMNGNMASKSGPSGVSSPTVTATSGTVTTENAMTSVDPVPLAGRALSMAGSGCSLKAEGAKVTFSCPQMTVANSFTTGQSEGELTLKGALTAVGDLWSAKLVPSSKVPKAP